MKRVLLQTVLFACFCLLSGMAYGQTGYLYQNDIEGWQDKIRYHSNGGNYVTCSQPSILSRPNHFAITDIHNYMIDAHVANGYYVQDFEIIDDYVFFCGYNSSMSGFIGWFVINDIFFSSGALGHANIDETLSSYGVDWLENIEVFRDKYERIHIAGVGAHIVSGVLTGYKAFEAVGYTPNSMQYRVADLKGKDAMPTLAVTDDFVVYATAEKNMYAVGIGFTLETFPRDDMFSLSSHPTYFFQTVVAGSSLYPTNSDPCLSSLGITHKEGNRIAIDNYRCDIIGTNFPVNNTFLLVLREYDLSPLLMSNPIQMISECRIYFPLAVSEIRKLAYDPLTKRYVTLFRNEVSPGVDEDCVMTMDYSSGTVPTVAQATYPQAMSNGSLYDMCLDGGSRYTVCGFDISANNYYYFWQDDVLSNAYSCANYINYSVDEKDVSVHKEDSCLSNVVGWIVLNFIPNMDLGIHEDNNILDCH